MDVEKKSCTEALNSFNNLFYDPKSGWPQLFIGMVHYGKIHQNAFIIDFFCEVGGAISNYCKEGKSALYVAVEKGNEKMARYLYQNGVPMQNAAEEDKKLQPLISIAASKNYHTVVKFLCENSKTSMVTVMNANEQMPLSLAINSYVIDNSNNFNQEDHVKTIQCLLDFKADVNERDKEKMTPLLTICHSSKYKNMEEHRYRMAKLLVEAGARLNDRDKSDKTPLIHAASHNNFTLMKYLIEKGAEVNAVDNNGYNTFSWAVIPYDIRDNPNFNKEEQIKILTHLVEQKADIHAPDKRFSRTPLIRVCDSPEYDSIEEHRFRVAKFLIDAGADIKAVDNRAKKTPLMWAVMKNNEAIINYLIEKGTNVNYKNENNLNSLSLAVANTAVTDKEFNKEQHLRIIKNLIDNKSELECSNDQQRTPLLMTCLSFIYDQAETHRMSVAKLLIDAGANVKAIDKKNRTPLFYAEQKNNKPLAEFLTKHKATQ